MSMKLLGRRGVVLLAGVSAAVFGFSSGAQASRFEASNVDATISGGDVAAINRCANDALDGHIDQRNSCQQLSFAGNSITLDNVSAQVHGRGQGHRRLFKGNHVTIVVYGGLSIAINLCINDAQDGTVTQINACTQTASAGNVLELSDVSVAVDS